MTRSKIINTLFLLVGKRTVILNTLFLLIGKRKVINNIMLFGFITNNETLVFKLINKVQKKD